MHVAGGQGEDLDTRKTAPGLRALDSTAVRCGGGDEPPPRARTTCIFVKKTHVDTRRLDCRGGRAHPAARSGTRSAAGPQRS